MSMSMSATKQRGFTLIELMIAMAIVAILSAIAYPSYQKHILKGYRANAQAAMMDIANREQQFLLSDRVYGDHVGLAATGYTLPVEIVSRYSYTIACTGPNAACTAGAVPAFTITFTAIGAQVNDTGATTLTLNDQGVKTPASKWK